MIVAVKDSERVCFTWKMNETTNSKITQKCFSHRQIYNTNSSADSRMIITTIYS